MSGWIKLHRSLLEWEWYSRPHTRGMFIHLLLTVNHKPSRYCGHDVLAGERVCGRIELASELGISERNVRTALEQLKTSGEVTSRSFSKFSIITISNWHIYQTDDQQVTSKRPASDQQVTTSKEGKKERNKVPTKKVTLEEWEAVNGVLTLDSVPKFKETYGVDAQKHLTKFRNSCEANGRVYANFAKALQTWEWPSPPKREAASWMKSQG